MTHHKITLRLALFTSVVVSTAALATEGVVQKIDNAQGKLTIKHGAITNLDMPAMTMIFKLSDPAMIAKVKTGDKIDFDAEKINGSLTVTRIAKAK